MDVGIRTLAARQRNLIRLEQLTEASLSESAVRSRLAVGRLSRLHAGVYATHPPPYSRHQLYLAAVYACGSGSVLSDGPAAGLLDPIEHLPLPAHVTNPTGSGRGRPGIVVHRRKVHSRDVIIRHGIPCTTPARTIIDCAHPVGAEGTEELIMAADAAHRLNRRRLEELATEHRGRPGVRHILDLITDDPAVTRSRNERRMLSICREFGVTRPLTNHRIDVGDRTFYGDFCWPDIRLIVEADSWRWHGGRAAGERDADRDQLLSIVGWRVVHFTRDQIRNARERTGRRLQALTRQASR